MEVSDFGGASSLSSVAPRFVELLRSVGDAVFTLKLALSVADTLSIVVTAAGKVSISIVGIVVVESWAVDKFLSHETGVSPKHFLSLSTWTTMALARADRCMT